MNRASSVRNRIRSAGRPASSAPTARPERLSTAAGGQAECRCRAQNVGIACGGTSEDRRQPHLVPEMEVVVGGRPVGAQADPDPTVEQRTQGGDARAEFAIGAGAMRHRHIVLGQQRHDPHRRATLRARPAPGLPGPPRTPAAPARSCRNAPERPDTRPPSRKGGSATTHSRARASAAMARSPSGGTV